MVPVSSVRMTPNEYLAFERASSGLDGFDRSTVVSELRAAIHFYPLLENAIRGGLKRDVGSHMTAMGRLFERLAAVAKDNPLATRREARTALETTLAIQLAAESG